MAFTLLGRDIPEIDTRQVEQVGLCRHNPISIKRIERIIYTFLEQIQSP